MKGGPKKYRDLVPTVACVGYQRFCMFLKKNRNVLKRLLLVSKNRRGKEILVFSGYTTPIICCGTSGKEQLINYVTTAEEEWVNKPKICQTHEDAEDFLARKLGIDHDSVVFQEF